MNEAFQRKVRGISRRQILQGGAATAVAVSCIANMANALSPPDRTDVMKLNDLIEALRMTEKEVCLTAANQLANRASAPTEFDLHLRRAGLDEGDAVSIAGALNNLSRTGGPTICSFSVSYNPNIREGGAIALINSLPKTVTEIGMVGCGLGDESGKVLWTWAQHAAALRMLCVEQNKYTPHMRQKISDLRKNRNGLVVIV